MNLVDPEGRKLKITGEQQNETLELLSKLYGGELKFEEDYVTINVEPDEYNKNSELIAEIINSENIVVELWTTNGKFTKNKKLFCGGAFMGSETEYSNGLKQVHTYQNINLNVLQKIDEYSGYQGRSLMHELTESYYGGKYAYKHNLDKVTSCIGINSQKINEHPVYSSSHSDAIETASVTQKFYKEGKEVFGNSDFDYVFWFVKYNGIEYVVQKFDNRKKENTK